MQFKIPFPQQLINVHALNWEDTNAHKTETHEGILSYVGMVDLPQYIFLSQSSNAVKRFQKLRQYLHVKSKENRSRSNNKNSQA